MPPILSFLPLTIRAESNQCQNHKTE
jgi:hypothetical protein